jgi:hypothetical protein
MKIYSLNDTQEFDVLLASRTKLIHGLIAFYHANQLEEESSQKLYHAIKKLNNGQNEITDVFANLASLMPSDLAPQGQARIHEIRDLQQAIETQVNAPFNLAIYEAQNIERNMIKKERNWILYPSLAIGFIQLLAIIAGIILLVHNLLAGLAISLLIGVGYGGLFIQAGYWGTLRGLENHHNKQMAPFKKLRDDNFEEAGFDGFAFTDEELESKLSSSQEEIKLVVAVPIDGSNYDGVFFDRNPTELSTKLLAPDTNVYG